MGEIADSLINGEFDSETGEYLGPPVGYPRTARDMNRKPSKSKLNKLHGLYKFMKKKGIDEQKCNSFIQKYSKSILNYEGTLKECAILIQKNFGHFREWFLKEIKTND